MNNKLLIAGIIAIAVGLVIFAGLSGSQTASSGSATISGSLPDNAGNVKPAPNFTLQKLGGGTISLAEFKTKKPVVLDFWASWCPNCQRDMPNLNRFYEQYKDKFEVIGVNLQEKATTVQNFIDSRAISFPIALDPRGQAANAFGVRYTNTHFLIDIDGNLVRTITGDIRETDIASLIK